MRKESSWQVVPMMERCMHGCMFVLTPLSIYRWLVQVDQFGI